ncbi:MAG TPA: hypothetical protein VFX16_09555 [Pseudonocardiaceae bacterium]|nr:hypothetical protein [Pseudonocardiaceae bacterium]
MRTRSILLWPFAVVWAAVRLLLWPAVALVVAYFLVPHNWFPLVLVLVGLYAAVVLRLWLRTVHGVLQSWTRGTVTVRGYTPRRRNRGRGRRGR